MVDSAFGTIIIFIFYTIFFDYLHLYINFAFQSTLRMSRFNMSLVYAIHGIKILLESGRNFRIHIVMGLLAIGLGVVCSVSHAEWLVIVLCIGLVLSLEAVNTGIEEFCNFVHPGKHSNIKIIKDISAASVLISAVTSLVLGLVIFVPKLVLVIGIILN